MVKQTTMIHPKRVHVVGAGLAGSEAAFYLAERGFEVTLYEMRPARMTEAHQTDACAELVCSNSLKSKDPLSGPGLLKAEMTAIGSLILESARRSEVPGGQALAVDRDAFSALVTQRLSEHPRIRRVNREVTEPIPEAATLFATGPLTSPALTEWIATLTGGDDFYFYDAIAPIVDAGSIDMESAFLANRYDKGEEQAYLNAPLNPDEYQAFIDALLAAEKVPPKNFEKEKYFQGCQPIETIAATGRDSLRFGPMKPIGLIDPRTGKRPWAVVQFRPENRSRTAYNLVGFQTRMKYGAQDRVLRLIPALKKAEFLRMGSIHRNSYLCGPKVLNGDLSFKPQPNVFFAGQITGVEGYLESAACGLLAALFIEQRLHARPFLPPPTTSALGALLKHVTASDPKRYQPANIHFGLFETTEFPGTAGLKKDGIRKEIARQSWEDFNRWRNALSL